MTQKTSHGSGVDTHDLESRVTSPNLGSVHDRKNFFEQKIQKAQSDLNLNEVSEKEKPKPSGKPSEKIAQLQGILGQDAPAGGKRQPNLNKFSASTNNLNLLSPREKLPARPPDLGDDWDSWQVVIMPSTFHTGNPAHSPETPTSKQQSKATKASRFYVENSKPHGNHSATSPQENPTECHHREPEVTSRPRTDARVVEQSDDLTPTIAETDSGIAIDASSGAKNIRSFFKGKWSSLQAESTPPSARQSGNFRRTESMPSQSIDNVRSNRKTQQRHTTDNVKFFESSRIRTETIEQSSIYKAKNSNVASSSSTSSGFSDPPLTIIEDEIEEERKNTITVELYESSRNGTMIRNNPDNSEQSDEPSDDDDDDSSRKNTAVRSDLSTFEVGRPNRPTTGTVVGQDPHHQILHRQETLGSESSGSSGGSANRETMMDKLKGVSIGSEPSLPEDYKQLRPMPETRKITLQLDVNVPLYSEGNRKSWESFSSADENVKPEDDQVSSSSESSATENSLESPKVGRPKRTTSKEMLETPAGYQRRKGGAGKGFERKRKTSNLTRQMTMNAGRKNLWADHEKVIESGILDTMGRKEREFNEVMYEIMITEGSYWKTLLTVCEVFMDPLYKDVNEKQQKAYTKFNLQKLFLNIRQLMDLSDKLVNAMEAKQGENVEMQNFLPELYLFLTEYFPKPYRYYATEKKQQEETLNKLMKESHFVQIVKTLQCDSKCRGLDLKSFLTNPIQKITRFTLHLDKIVKLCKIPHMNEHIRNMLPDAEKALEAARQLSAECNDADGNMQELERIIQLQRLLDVPTESGAIDHIKLTKNRDVAHRLKLIKQGELVKVTSKGLISGVKTAKLHCFLFNEFLLITQSVMVDNKSRFLVEEAALDFRVETRTSKLISKHKHLGMAPTNAFWTKCLNLECGKCCSAKKIGDQSHISDKIREHGQVQNFLFLFNNDASELERWKEAFKGTSNKLPREMPPHTKNSWYEAQSVYEEKQSDELSVLPGNHVKSFSESGNWIKGVLLNEKLRVGWLPLEVLAKQTKSKVIEEKERKLETLIENLRNN